jgi:hypothetical protein
VERIRVAVSDPPGLLRDIITRVVLHTPDMTLVDDNGGDGPGVDDFDVLIELHEEPGELERVPTLLVRRARPRVLAVADHGRDSVFWELLPRAVPIKDLSPEELVQIIRAAVRPGAELPLEEDEHGRSRPLPHSGKED